MARERLPEWADPTLFSLHDAGAGFGQARREPARPEKHPMNDAINSPRNEAMRGPWLTPARARGLAAAAAGLYRQLREADLARDADPDLARRRAGWRLDVAAAVCTVPPRSHWSTPVLP